MLKAASSRFFDTRVGASMKKKRHSSMCMVPRRLGILSLAMIAIMLLAVQIPLANELGRAENGIPTYTSTSCSSTIPPIDSAIHVDVLNGSD